ncbi:hypothetical protein EYF80_053747 [Liparis tanakae]|uniref:Uncharacterized protein n=1 Tax=Liparis tanakae TaxID=230148 RepID=A0A4Z2F5A3_9TELE|nr:hypothetical protein EYF80_053747 [Liparis tanakae]
MSINRFHRQQRINAPSDLLRPGGDGEEGLTGGRAEEEEEEEEEERRGEGRLLYLPAQFKSVTIYGGSDPVGEVLKHEDDENIRNAEMKTPREPVVTHEPENF